MADPITFPSTTARFSLPLLFAGQAQKEPFINHAFSLVDALIENTVVDSLTLPPADPEDGTSYRVLGNASDAWQNQDDKIAIWIGEAWEFISPAYGMIVFDQAADLQLRYHGTWQAAIEPEAPSGGTTVDVEARATIDSLIEALRVAGIFENSSIL